MGKLIKNHWARLIVLTAATCKPFLFSPLHAFLSALNRRFLPQSTHQNERRTKLTFLSHQQTKSPPPSKASSGPKSSGTFSPPTSTVLCAPSPSCRSSTCSSAFCVSPGNTRSPGFPALPCIAASRPVWLSTQSAVCPRCCCIKARTRAFTTWSGWACISGLSVRAR